MNLTRIENNNFKKGFTLLEVLLTIAMIGVLFGFSVFVYRSFQLQGDLDSAQSAVVHSLRRAQILSQSVDGDISWGVDVRSGKITLFKGASYAARDTAFDEVFDVPSTIVFSGVNEIVFAKFSGFPSPTGSIILTSVTGNVLTVAINSKGMVGY